MPMEPARPTLYRSIDRALLFVETHAMIALLLGAIVIGPYFLITLKGMGPAGAAGLLLLGGLLAFLLLTRQLTLLSTWSVRAATILGLPGILLLGMTLQLMVAIATHPVPVSDGAVYSSLARQLAEGLSYQDADGHRAFWPPGLPLYLAPFIWVLQDTFTAVIVANLVLYGIGAFGAWLLGRNLFNPITGTIAALLFTLWPSRLLLAGLASKENLTIAAMTLGLAVFTLGLSRRKPFHALACSAAAGTGFGIASLAQPGLLLFVAALSLAFRHLRGDSWLRYLMCCAFALACAAATLAPWQMRNCKLFEGQFCGISTNGGSVFYRANNPLATGEWTAEGKIRITHLPELEQNRLGFELGKQWIKENPGAFISLGLSKLALLLRDDRFGAYWAVLRGTGLNHKEALVQASPSRMFSFHVLNTVSWVFWAVVLGLAARHLAAHRAEHRIGQCLPLLYPLLYCAGVFFVFESDRRQHMIAFAPLMVMACATLADMARHARTTLAAQVAPHASAATAGNRADGWGREEGGRVPENVRTDATIE